MRVTQQQVGMYNEDTDHENVYPVIQMVVADPDGIPWNKIMIDIFPNEGEIDSDVDSYRN